MHLGFGLYRHQLNEAEVRFAAQCGATHVVVHLVDYFKGGANKARDDQPVSVTDGEWGECGTPGAWWTPALLDETRALIERHGLVFHAIENFDPAHWFDILLDGPRRDEHVAGICTMIERAGRAGVKVIGYNFSLAGVYGRIKGPFGRGGAEVVGMKEVDHQPIRDGVVWNMQLPPDITDTARRARVDEDTLWDRARRFLEDVLPTAERAGVRLAAHPDDPPVDRLRDTPRLIRRPNDFLRFLDLVDHPSNVLELCLGTLAEMPGDSLYDVIDACAARQRIGYIHFRNVRGKAPHYMETFIDEGDLDMRRVLTVLRNRKFNGVLIPDHAPGMTCAAPWHAGMAYAMGYMRALFTEQGSHL